VTDFFISYNRADRPWAEWIGWQLERAGYSAVVQAWDFAPGSNFVAEMDRALREAVRLIAVLSPSYLAAPYTRAEWAAAFTRDPVGEKRSLVPVRVRACVPEGLLASIVYVDLVGLEEAAAREALLRGVEAGRPLPASPPPFPADTATLAAAAVAARFPGSLPPLWNVPHLRNQRFRGRSELLDRLHEALHSGVPGSHVQAVRGLGGVGKTQLALEYLYRWAADYSVVWWVRAEESATMRADYAALGAELGLPASEERVALGAVRRWLEHNSGWVLTFDDVRDPGELRELLPRAATGHVLLTTRHAGATEVAAPFPVGIFTRSESIEYLTNRVGAETDVAGGLAAELGDLPLALEQAAAYVQARCISLSRYRELLDQYRTEILSRGKPSSYPQAVANTWDISFDSVQKASAAAAELVSLCAFLAPDDIPRQLLRSTVGGLTGPLAAALGSPLTRDDPASIAAEYSLVSLDEDCLSVHPLVQTIACFRCSKKVREHWAAVALRFLVKAFTFDRDDPTSWAWTMRLLPHVLAATRHAEELGVGAEEEAWLLNGVGRYLHSRAELDSALAHFERALRLDEATFGPHHMRVGVRLTNIGAVLRDQGDLMGALASTRRALAIHEAILGSEDPAVSVEAAREVASASDGLGMILLDLGRLDEARAQVQRALDLDEVAAGLQSAAVSARCNHLGLILKELGDLEGALRYTERALVIARSTSGEGSPAVGLYSNNLGQVFYELGELDHALRHTRQALEIAESMYGLDHPIVAASVSNLGQILQDKGDLDGALRAIERALRIDEPVYGSDHPQVAVDRSNLGQIFAARGDFAGALRELRRALAIDEAAYDAPHREVAKDRLNLARVLEMSGDLTAALAQTVQALAVLEALHEGESALAATARERMHCLEAAVGDSLH
jgi:tetratricopeptide (TPR) repeat protein